MDPNQYTQVRYAKTYETSVDADNYQVSNNIMTENKTETTATQGGIKVLRVINLGHPLSEVAIEQIGNPIIETAKVQIDLDAPIATQISAIIDGIETPLDGSVAGLAFVLPGMSEATAYLLAEIHGRTGTFPNVVPLRRDDHLGVFVVADEGVQSLEKVRQDARRKRGI